MDAEYPELIFESPFDEQSRFEAKARGWAGSVHVRTPDGATYPVEFYDTVRLAQDLEYEVSTGRPFIAEPGLIVLTEVTVETMEAAVRTLFQEGYFDRLRPVGDDTS